MLVPSRRKYLMACPNITIPLVVCPSIIPFLDTPSKNRSLHLHGAGFNINGFEFSSKNKNTQDSIIVNHRPKDAQVSQLYRIPSDASSTTLERLTYFDIGSGRIIQSFTPVFGEDWRGTLRAGGALMVMDLTGNENFQLWYEARAPSFHSAFGFSA
jgi:hypothetical protein